MSEFAEFAVHVVDVQTRTGSGSLGPVFAATVERIVYVEETRRLVRGPDASEVVSEATLYDFDPAQAPTYALGSRVTLPSGRVATVLAVSAHTSGALELPDHVEVALT